MDAKELKRILKEHAAWVENSTKGNRADLQGADLHGASLYRANLREAVLRGANLHGANLRCADLQGANLREANLREANLRGANLQWASLREANLRGADLHGANLRGANLREANLREANLQWANLHGADLQWANLHGADLRDEILIAYTSITPEGQLVGWKKCKDGVIVKLSIPSDSPRSNATGRKCRAKFVDVLEVFGAKKGISQNDEITEYAAGKRVECDSWCEDRWQECAGGIHFFLTRYEAENY